MSQFDQEISTHNFETEKSLYPYPLPGHQKGYASQTASSTISADAIMQGPCSYSDRRLE